VLSLVVRDGEGRVPDADTRLRTGDSLLVVATVESRQAAEDRLRAVSANGKLARWYTVP
jgi:cell volume regulation protein A